MLLRHEVLALWRLLLVFLGNTDTINHDALVQLIVDLGLIQHVLLLQRVLHAYEVLSCHQWILVTLTWWAFLALLRGYAFLTDDWQLLKDDLWRLTGNHWHRTVIGLEGVAMNHWAEHVSVLIRFHLVVSTHAHVWLKGNKSYRLSLLYLNNLSSLRHRLRHHDFLINLYVFVHLVGGAWELSG